MKALLDDNLVAESDDIVECSGYQYFRALQYAWSGSRKHKGPSPIDPARTAFNSTMW